MLAVRFLISLLHVAVLVAACSANPYLAVCELRAPTHTGSGTLIGTSGDTALILSFASKWATSSPFDSRGRAISSSSGGWSK
jgi:hypothetical protein